MVDLRDLSSKGRPIIVENGMTIITYINLTVN